MHVLIKTFKNRIKENYKEFYEVTRITFIKQKLSN